MVNSKGCKSYFHHEIHAFLKEEFRVGTIHFVELIQELWSGYGSLERWDVNGESIIVKLIQNQKVQKHSRGWSSDVGHVRKVKSYEIEQNFYRQFSSKHHNLDIPRLFSKVRKEQYSITVLEDLKNHHARPISNPNEDQIQNSLRWLAKFHAEFLGDRAKGLWEQGRYWYLNTRREEYERMEDRSLKEKARAIDDRLQFAQFQTIIHGDAKSANFLYNEEKAFAVDFQYVGKGAGIIDVMYFFSSCLANDELFENVERLLEDYFAYLKTQIGNQTVFKKLEMEWRALYPFAWADFLRFLDGWSPGHWKMGEYANEQKRIALETLSDEH